MKNGEEIIDALNKINDKVGRLHDRREAKRKEFEANMSLELAQELANISSKIRTLLEDHDKLLSKVFQT